MAALGLVAAMINWSILARREGKPEGYGSELAFWMMLSGVLGARVAYVIANYPVFMTNPLEIIRVDRGGLIYYGGFLGAAAALVWFARVRKERLLSVADLAVTGLPLGHAFGRIGCFLNGCCYGSITTVPWAVRAAGAHRHPTQLYESGMNLAIFAFLVAAYLRRDRRQGSILTLYLLVYPAGRFVLEFFRGDERLGMPGLNAAQLVSIALFAAGTGLLVALSMKAGAKHSRTMDSHQGARSE